MVTFYDEALLAKIQNWTEKTKIHVYGPNESEQLKELLADETKDGKIKLPIIALSRPDGFDVVNSNKIPMTCNGTKVGYDEDSSTILNAIPININYKLDVYTKKKRDADAFMRELIFNIVNYPQVTITIPYMNVTLHHYSNVRMASEHVSDNSSSISLSKDQIANLQIDLDIDDAYMFDTRINGNVRIASEGLNLKIQSDENDIVTEPILIDYEDEETNS